MSSENGSLTIWCAFDLADKEKQVQELEKQAVDPLFWNNPKEAQRTMQRLTRLKGEVDTWKELESKASTLEDLLGLAIEEQDISLSDTFQAELQEITGQLETLEWSLLFSSEYDQRDAILAIHAGAGGTESQDWAQMLLRMYLRWAERQGYQGRVLDISPGEEAGVKSATVEISGRNAYGYLKGEAGVHRLVRISPFDAAHSRHTSFALVEALPQAQEEVDVIINPEDLRIDVFRSSGAGGQNVQKNATAVRIVHLPTGIRVSCQNERSQYQNKEIALKILRARLVELELKKLADERARLKGEHVSAEWGNQIRSYVLHPYKMVKDHRTGYETHDANAVLDGELDELLRAYLFTTMGKNNK